MLGKNKLKWQYDRNFPFWVYNLFSPGKRSHGNAYSLLRMRCIQRMTKTRHKLIKDWFFLKVAHCPRFAKGGYNVLYTCKQCDYYTNSANKSKRLLREILNSHQPQLFMILFSKGNLGCVRFHHCGASFPSHLFVITQFLYCQISYLFLPARK